MNFNRFEVYGNPTLQQGGWVRTGVDNDYVAYAPYDPNYPYRTCTLNYVPQHHPTQITITGIASKELEVSVLVLRSDNYIIASLGWQDNGYTFNLGSTYDKLGVMFRFKNGDTITPNQVSFDIVGDWHNISHYIHNTSTDTLTTLPAMLYPNAVTATVGLKGDMSQSGTPTPNNPIQPSECGERTGNLFDGTLQGGVWEATLILNTSVNTAVYKSFSINLPVGTYTLSFNRSVNIVRNIVNNVYSETSISNVSNFTFTVNSNYTVYISFRDATSSTTVWDNSQIMLNTGSTPLPYEPWGVKIPISSANTTTPVYLGEVESTRKIKKLVLTGNEGWTIIAEGLYRIMVNGYLRISKMQVGISSHFGGGYTVGAAPSAKRDEIAFLVSNSSNNFVYVSPSQYLTMADFKTYLQQEYTNGRPVTIWYILASPETAVVNEPIRKIGDYADEVSGITIPTIAGANTIDVDTALKPSEVTATYKGWHPVSAVHERDNSQWD